MHFKRCRRLLVPSWRIEKSSRVNIKMLLCSLRRSALNWLVGRHSDLQPLQKCFVLFHFKFIVIDKLNFFFLNECGIMNLSCHCRMNWTWRIRTGRPCSLCPMRKNGKSIAARRRWVAPPSQPLPSISSGLWLALRWQAAWSFSLGLKCQQWMYCKWRAASNQNPLTMSHARLVTHNLLCMTNKTTQYTHRVDWHSCTGVTHTVVHACHQGHT